MPYLGKIFTNHVGGFPRPHHRGVIVLPKGASSLAALLLLGSSSALASGGSAESVAPLLLALGVITLAGRLGGYLAELASQPAVLGELTAGIAIGSLPLVGIPFFGEITSSPAVASFLQEIAHLGVVLLLFEVGLETHLRDLLKVGPLASAVAIVGVVAPFGLGYFVSAFFMPNHSVYVHLFTGATLSATSVGITARVFRDLDFLDSGEAKVILGSALIDDVLALIILAIVGALIEQAGTGTQGIPWGLAGLVTLKALLFLVLGLGLGYRIMGFLGEAFKFAFSAQPLAACLLVCALFAYLADLAGLAPIVGAFIAGVCLDQPTFEKKLLGSPSETPSLVLHSQLNGLSQILVPIFFVQMGLGVRLNELVSPKALSLGLGLTVAAIVGKQICGLVVPFFSSKPLSKRIVGLGMVPRGEVGLIFVAIGATLTLDGNPVVDETLYSAIVLMVIGTTMFAPIALKLAIDAKNRHLPQTPSA